MCRRGPGFQGLEHFVGTLFRYVAPYGDDLFVAFALVWLRRGIAAALTTSFRRFPHICTCRWDEHVVNADGDAGLRRVMKPSASGGRAVHGGDEAKRK